MQISELLGCLGELKAKANSHYVEYKNLKEVEDVMKAELLAMLSESGLKSAKGDKYLASISERSDIVVTHEQSVIEWLKTTPNVEADAYIGLKVATFKTLANEVLKTTGEVIPGTDRITKQSLTIKGVKK